MTLDLGALVGYVTLDTLQFDRAYPSVVRRLSQLGVRAEGAAVGANSLDRSLAGVAAASNGAATGLGRADRALTEAGLSASGAATATAALADATTEAGLAESRLTQAVLRQTAAQERYNALVASGTATTRQLAAAEATLIAANDRVALSQERLGKATGLTSSAWQSAGRKMLIAGGVIGLGFAVAGRGAANFDEKMALVRTLAKASPAEMGQLREAALSVGQAYGYSADQVADAEAELIKANVSVADQINGALVGALTLAAAGQMDVANATEIAAVAMTLFHKRGQDVPHIADLLAAGADRALGSVQDLGEALKYGGLAASQADWSIEQTIGTLAELAQAGQMGSTAGAGLAMMLQNLVKPSEAAGSMLDRYNITLYDSNGQFISATNLAGQLHDKIGSLSKAEQDAALATIFTSRARRVATILTRDGAKANQEWIDTVNEQGFAALQAAGKLDSLNGDVTKLGTALHTAFIGSGEDAQGPLREVVQDVTAVVEAWNDLPAPVRLAAEALIGVAGAAALAGGAAILLIPKWQAMNEALTATTGRAVTARGALLGLGKVSVAAVALVGLYEGAMLLQGALEETGPTVEEITADLINMGKQGSDSADALIDTLVGLSQVDIGVRGSGLADWGDLTKNLDEALTNLVTSGHADMARDDFDRINAALLATGMSVEDITKLFPAYGRALADSANEAELSADGIDSHGNAVTDDAKAMQDAVDAAKAYSDALHTLTDPVFAMNSALTDLADKQQAAAKATRKYGEDSRQAHQANLDLASSAVQVETASRDLATAVQTGDVSVRKASARLRQWVHDGALTESQARDVAQSFGGLIDRANTMQPAVRRAGAAASAASGGLDALGGSASRLAHNLSGAGASAADSFGAGFMGAWDNVIAGIHTALANLPKVHGSPSVNEMAPVLFIPAGEMLMGGLVEGIERGGHRVVDATHRVFREIAQAVAPQITDPNVLSAMLTAGTGRAVRRDVTAQRAHQDYRDAKAYAKFLDDAAQSARHLADSDERAWQKAKQLADGMKSETAAQKSAKAAAEDHARALHETAKASDDAADAAERTARRWDRTAEKAKKAWDKAAAAADRAVQKAADTARQLVDTVTAAFDDMLAQVHDFQSAISDGIVGDDSLGTLWGNLVDAQSSAAADLAAAQEAVASAQSSLVAAGADASVEQMQALADAKQALAAAQAAYDAATANVSAHGLQTSLDTILTSAEGFATDLSALADAGASKEFLAQIAQMGYGAGDALAKALLAAGPEAIASLQASMAAIQAVADGEGDLLADRFYGGGLHAMENFLKGLMEKFPELKTALAGMVAEIDAILLGTTVAATGPAGPGLGFGHVPGGVAGTIGGIAGVTLTPLSVPALSRGTDGAAAPVMAVLHPDDRALLTSVAQRPVTLIADRAGQRVIGEIAQDHRSERQDHGDPRYAR